MNRGYLLDTDICISLLREKHCINEKIKAVGIKACSISEITLLELRYGAINSQQPAKHLAETEKIEALFQVLPISHDFDFFASEKVRLQRAGALIPGFDLLIGCSAVVHHLTAVTNNVVHLSRLNGLIWENWREAIFNEFLR